MLTFAMCALLGVLGSLCALLVALLVPALRPPPRTVALIRWRRLLNVGSVCSFFGLGGLLASWLGLAPPLPLLFALLSGLMVGGGHVLALWLAGPPAEVPPSLVGHTGRVLQTGRQGQSGRVLLLLDSREALPAQSADHLTPGDRVLVVADAGSLLDVRRWDGR